MSGNRNNWLKSWLKPSNLIAFGSLIIAVIGVWGGIKVFANRQVIKGTDNCEITNSEQELSGNASTNQTIDCSNSTFDGIRQNKSN